MSNRSVTAGPTKTKFHVESPPERDFFWDFVDNGKWEPETFEAMRDIIGPGDRVIDVGAWIGITALYAASLGADVVAYEPDPKAIDEMRVNLNLNEGLPVSIRAVALRTEPGVALLKSSSLGDSMSSLVREVGDLTDSVEVECQGIEHEAQAERFAEARLIKVDIEGYEFSLLPAMMRTLRRDGFDGDILLSTHVYPTVEKTVQRLLRARTTEPTSYRYRGMRRIVTRFGLPLLMLRDNLRLLWCIRGAASTQICRGRAGRWERFSLKGRIWFVVQPRDGELWLSWRSS